MPGNLTFEALKVAVDDGTIDTVAVVMIDMQGRLLGKRFHALNFIEHACKETHCCNYLLATDLEMATPDGYQSTSWSAGYGDYVMQPDLTTLRLMPWVEGAAMVFCDVLDHHTQQPVPHSPRAVLKQQIDRLQAYGFSLQAATELEFFLFRESYEEARDKQYRGMSPMTPYNEDYHIFRTASEEKVMRPVRNHLIAAGIPVECTKGEAEAGQEELNIRYSDALDTADNHSFAKHAVKEIAQANGHSVSFVAKLHEDTVGSSSHVHQSLLDKDGRPVFYDKSSEHGMSSLMRHFLAGQLAYAGDITAFLAPYINSYKRFAKGTFAPTKIIWSIDNRTSGFRIVAPNSAGVRIECRIGGSDMNPYLAMAGLLAAGIAGIEQSLELPPAYSGDAYSADKATDIPMNLRAATQTLRESSMLRQAFGDEVITHYVRAAEWEQEEFDRIVTGYEIRRGFERA